jgi:hypothetical protein
MNFTVSIFTKSVIAEFFCTDFNTDGKEIQNLGTEIILLREAKHDSQCADFDENRA